MEKTGRKLGDRKGVGMLGAGAYEKGCIVGACLRKGTKVRSRSVEKGLKDYDTELGV